jgi:hypothetical protein
MKGEGGRAIERSVAIDLVESTTDLSILGRGSRSIGRIFLKDRTEIGTDRLLHEVASYLVPCQN